MSDPDAMSIRRLWGWLALVSVPAVAVPGVVAKAALLPDAIGSVSTFGLTPHFFAARLAFPLVTVSGMVLVLLPGLMLALMSRRAHSLSSWVVASVPITLAMLVLLPVIAAAAGGFPTGRSLAIGTLLLSAACAGGATVVRRRRGITQLPVIRPDAVGFAVGVPLLLLAMLAPKFLWEDFNGDGAHAFEASTLLLSQPWPFFPAAAGDVASFPGMTSMLFTFPNAWFLGVYGEVEASVRMPFVMHLALLACAIRALAEVGRAPLTRNVLVAIWASLAAFTVTIAFSATYSRYNADLAMPGTQDTLLMVCVLGFAIAMVQRSWAMAAAFGFASHVSLPSGLLLLGFWVISELVVMRPRPWRALATGLAIIVGSVLVASVLGMAIAASGSPGPGTEYGMRRTIADLMVLQVADWRRFLYAAIPGGIFPAVAMLLWRRQDDVARRVTVVALAYFAFFYVQSRISLHHFVPAMILPMVVAARVIPAGDAGRRWTLAWLAAAGVAVVAALPGTFAVSRVARPVARAISHAPGNAADTDATRRFARLRAGPLLGELFPPDWSTAVPDSTYGGSMLVWLHYMHPGEPDEATNYLLADAGATAPVGMRRIAAAGDAVLYVRSDSILAHHRGVRPVGVTGAPIFRIAQRDLFEGRGGRGQVHVGAALRRVGLDPDALLRSPGN